MSVCGQFLIEYHSFSKHAAIFERDEMLGDKKEDIKSSQMALKIPDIDQDFIGAFAFA